MRSVTRRDALGLAAGAALAVSGCRGGPVRRPKPTAVLRTRWGEDPWARGAYSFLPVGASPADRRRLAVPVADRLFFAGEATSTRFAGTAHGAYLSGRRAAREVLDVARGGASVVVVGAGLSGLAAARALADAGIRAVVLEARARVGGRIRTAHSTGSQVELGAAWIHGVRGNPLVALAREAGRSTARFDYDKSKLFRAGEAVDPSGPERRLARLLQRAASHGDALDDDISLAAGLRRARRPRNRLLDTLIASEIEHEHAADVDELSLWWWDEGHELPGGDALVLRGYDALPRQLATDLDIRLGTPATRIAWHRDGVEAGGLHADHAIVTTPIGLLKEGRPRFEPALPRAHRLAIARLGAGLLDKVYLRFDEPFWDTELDLFRVAGTRPREFAEWVNLHKFTGEPALIGFNAGTAARRLARLDDGTFTARALDALAHVG